MPNQSQVSMRINYSPACTGLEEGGDRICQKNCIALWEQKTILTKEGEDVPSARPLVSKEEDLNSTVKRSTSGYIISSN